MGVPLNFLNRNRFRMMTLLLKFILLELRLQLQNSILSCATCKQVWILKREFLLIFTISWIVEWMRLCNNSNASLILANFLNNSNSKRYSQAWMLHYRWAHGLELDILPHNKDEENSKKNFVAKLWVNLWCYCYFVNDDQFSTFAFTC